MLLYKKLLFMTFGTSLVYEAYLIFFSKSNIRLCYQIRVCPPVTFQAKWGGGERISMTHGINIFLAQTNHCHILLFLITNITNWAALWTSGKEQKRSLRSWKPSLKNIMSSRWHEWERTEMRTEFQWRSLKERHYFGNPCTYKRSVYNGC